MQPSIPPLASISRLYRFSLELSTDAASFHELVEQLRRLAANVEVLALKSGEQGRVFQVIAREVGVVSVQLRESITQLLGSSSRIAEQAMSSASGARTCERYALALARGTQGPSAERARQCLAEGSLRLADELAGIRRSLQSADLLLEEIERLHIMLPVMASQINVEAARYREAQRAMAGNAEQLLTMKDALAGLHRRIRRRARQTTRFLMDLMDRYEL